MEDFLGKHRSRPYNPLVANTFYRAGYIESWGRGIMKIREACKNAGNKEPRYNIKTDELTVAFEANESFAKGKTLIEPSKPLIDNRKEAFAQLIDVLKVYSISRDKLMIIFDSFCDAECFGRKDIKQVCAVETTTAGELLGRLKTCHAIEPVSGHGKGKYRFIV